MNELTFLIAVLVRKDVLTVVEASALLKASKEGVINGNVGEMVAKVDRALKRKTDDVEKVDAKEFMKDL